MTRETIGKIILIAGAVGAGAYALHDYFSRPIIKVDYDTRKCVEVIDARGNTVAHGCEHLDSIRGIQEWCFYSRADKEYTDNDETVTSITEINNLYKNYK